MDACGLRFRQFAFTLGLPYTKFKRKINGPIDLEDPTSEHIWQAARGLIDVRLGNLLAIRAEVDRRMRVAERSAARAKMKRGIQREQNTN